MNAPKEIRVRFAPSPTGYLHVGGARTALFNWLYARKTGGKFILRIEDTDQERSTDEATAAILRGMEWLGLDWDEGPNAGGDCGPYFQSERLDIYRDAADKLRDTGALYPCYCTSDEIQARNVAKGEEAFAGYDNHCRELTTEQIATFEGEGRKPSWRLRTPDEGSTFWYDIIYDKREFPNDALTDRVAIKQDGFPTYNFAVVVDDHLMGISHCLRGDDHVSNTPFQILAYQALGWDVPKFGHMPMILGADRKRLSKRHGATSVEEFAKMGILPDAMVNYLALLGWSPGGSGDEVFARTELIKKFSLKKVNSAPAGFDYDKLNHINAQHLKRLEPKQRLALTMPLLQEYGWDVDQAWHVPASNTQGYTKLVLKTLGGRFSSLLRLPEQIGFFFTEDYTPDEAAVAEHLGNDAARDRLGRLADACERDLPADEPATKDAFEEVVRAVAEASALEAGDLIHPARVALTGQTRSAGIFEVMWLIGTPRVIARLRRAAASS
jgi:glutamyl-tRNA synthetase